MKNNKQSLWLEEGTIKEAKVEAQRLDRSLSWTMCKAWRLARERIRKLKPETR
jgi:uncharacterized small protein (TIGR04563 family)